MTQFAQTWQQLPLASLDTYQILVGQVSEIVKFDLEEEAYNLARDLDRKINEIKLRVENPELYTQYGQLTVKLKWVALPLLPEKEVASLFSNSLSTAWLLPDCNLWQKLHSKLISILVYEDRDKLKHAIREALLGNRERLALNTGEKLTFTIGELFSSYNRELGIGMADKVKQTQFLVGSSLLKKLPATSRGQMHDLLNLYERCKLSSLTLEGLEETIPMDGRNPGVVKEGQFEVFDGSVADKIISEAIAITVPPNKGTSQPIFAVGKIDKEVTSTAPINRLRSAPLVVGSYKSVINSTETVRPTFAPSLKPTPQVMKTAEPAFLFDEDDEREADKFRATSSSPLATGGLEKQLKELAEEVVKQNNITFKEEGNRRRFILLFVSRLKDVRGIVELREALQKSSEAGGLGLTPDKVEQVLGVIEKAKKDFEAQSSKPKARKPVSEIDKLVTTDMANNQWPLAASLAKALTPQPLPSQLAVVAPTPQPEVKLPSAPIPIRKGLVETHGSLYEIPKPQVVGQKAENVGTLEHLSTGALEQKNMPPVQQPPLAPRPSPITTSSEERVAKNDGKFDSAKLSEWREEMLKEIAQAAPPASSPIVPRQSPLEKPESSNRSSPIVTKTRNEERGTSSASARPRMEDVKAPPRVVGPLEEIKTLTLTDFKRLAPSSPEALAKVLAKIELIGEASVGKRLQAVRAWQASPLYQLYLKLGQESIEQGKTIAALAQDYSGQGGIMLSEQEFNAIVDFNAKLRF